MSTKIFGIMYAVLNKVGGGFVFLFGCALIFSFFVLTFFLSIFKTGYGLKKRVWFLAFCIGVLSIEYALLSLTNEKELCFVALGFSCILSAIVFAIPKKALRVTKEQRSLARIIDEQVKKSQTPPEIMQKEILQSQTIRCEKPLVNPQVAGLELDFQHVKSVISRMEFYPLSMTDKKTVRELENAILTAEQGEFSPIVKSRINDGLGALLKIMSKYGV